MATPGLPRKNAYDMFNLTYEYHFTNPTALDEVPAQTSKVTEIYLPARRYGQAFEDGDVQVNLSDGSWTWDEKVGAR